jgi:hypothetical protein
MKQPAAATADNWINWRLAILLKGLSFIVWRIGPFRPLYRTRNGTGTG